MDEAWCVDTTGQTCWGVKLPMKEGWSRIAAPSHEFGTSADVDQALALMDLSLPFTPETLKERVLGSREAFESSGVRFTVSVGMRGGEINASDWIYAAGFAAHSDGGVSRRLFWPRNPGRRAGDGHPGIRHG